MEITKVEVAAVEQVLAQEVESQLQHLNELQLLMVGGGMGDVNFG